MQDTLGIAKAASESVMAHVFGATHVRRMTVANKQLKALNAQIEKLTLQIEEMETKENEVYEHACAVAQALADFASVSIVATALVEKFGKSRPQRKKPVKKTGETRTRRTQLDVSHDSKLILQHLDQEGVGMKDLIAATGLGAPAIRSALKRLEAAGEVMTEGEKRWKQYRLPKPGEQPPAAE